LFFLILGKIFFEKKLIKKKIKEVFFILAIPILISFFISIINTNESSKRMRFIQEIKIDLDDMHLNQRLDLKIFISFKTRIDTWKEILNNSKKPLIGYGAQADKYLTKNLPSHTQLASNSFIYSYACAGLLGVITLIIIYYNLLKLLCKVAILNKIKNKLNNLKIFYVVVLFFLIIRSIVENSFALWGIDFVLMVNSYFGLKNLFTRKIYTMKN
jgi:O-antigen ligase